MTDIPLRNQPAKENKEKTLTERTILQKVKLTESTVEKLYSLAAVAKISGVSYKSCYTYSHAKDPRLENSKRYPDQTGRAYILYTQEAIRIVQIMRKEGLSRRGRPAGFKCKWTERAKQKLKEDRKRTKFYETRKKRTRGPSSMIKKAGLLDEE